LIYICIPAHNEERTVGVLLWKIRQVMAGFPRDYQILVANDGSTDRTTEVLSPYQRVLPLTVIHIDRRRGYANALELLLREAVRRAEYPKRDVVVTLQADFTDDPDQILAMLKRIEAGADVVAANLELPRGAPRSLRWPRWLGNYLLRKRSYPDGVSDPLYGVRAYRVMVIKRALEGRGPERLLTWDGWAANAELLRLTQPHSRRTEGIACRYRGERQQRSTRNGMWPLLTSLYRYAKGGTGPLAGEPLVTPSTVDLRDRKRQRSGPPQSESRSERKRGDPAAARMNGKESAGGGRDRARKGQRPRAADKVRDNRRNGAGPAAQEKSPEIAAENAAPAKKKRRRRRGPRRSVPNSPQTVAETPQAGVVGGGGGDEAESPGAGDARPDGELPQAARRKRRSRRGGRGRRGRGRARGASPGSTTEGNGDAPADTTAAPPEPPST
jgi:glycosyl transferase family 2